MTALALAVSIVAVVVSVGSAIYAARVSREVGGSGFRAEEQLKTDLVTLVSALRSVTVKGTLASQDGVFRPLEAELGVIRGFASSTSGFGLMGLAAERGAAGASDDEAAGRWRTLSLNLGNLAGAIPATAADNVHLATIATDIELTLEALKSNDVRKISTSLRDLPAVFDTLRETRSQDIVLRTWFELRAENARASAPEAMRPELERLRAIGVDDPDLDLWLGVLDGDTSAVQDALDRGANPSTTIETLLDRHAADATSSSG